MKVHYNPFKVIVGIVVLVLSFQSSWGQVPSCTPTPKPFTLKKTVGISQYINPQGIPVIRKTNLYPAWNAGASTNLILKEGDYLEYNVSVGHVMVGLSVTDPDVNFRTINYALYTALDSKVYVYENGVIKTSPIVNYTVSSTLKIEIKGGKVMFYGGVGQVPVYTLFYTSQLNLINPKFIVDISMFTPNAEISNLQIFKCGDNIDSDNDGLFDQEDACAGFDDAIDNNFNGIPDDCEGTCNPKSKPYIVTNAIGIGSTVNQGITAISKTNTTGGWTAGGSTNLFLSEGDYITYKATLGNNTMVGLSTIDKNVNYSTINNALLIDTNNQIQIYENITQVKAGIGVYSANSIIKILIEGGKIKYFCDGNLLYVSASTIASTKMVVDFSLGSLNAQIIDLKIWQCCADTDNDGVCDTDEKCPGNDDKIDINPQNGLPDNCDGVSSTPYSVSYDLLKSAGISVGVTVTGEKTITQTLVSNSIWSQGGSTNISLSEGDYITYNVKPGFALMVGLSKQEINFSFTTIDYALFTTSSISNNINVYEKGIVNNNGSLGTYDATSVFKIVYEYGGKIKYYCNEKLIYFSYVAYPEGTPLIVDFSMASHNAQIIDLKIFKSTYTAIELLPESGPKNQQLCKNTALTVIAYTTTGATGIGVTTGLPTGVTATWASNGITISGTPTISGTFNYTITLLGGNGSVSATGTITVNEPPSAGVLSGNQQILQDAQTTFTSTVSGGTWSSNNVTIATINTASGVITPVSLGDTFMTYTVLGTGGCGSVTSYRTIKILPVPVVNTDTELPTFTCPVAQREPANDECQANVPNFISSLGATDNVTPTSNLIIKQEPPVGTAVTMGPTAVTITVKDAAGNVAHCTTTFTAD